MTSSAQTFQIFQKENSLHYKPITDWLKSFESDDDIPYNNVIYKQYLQKLISRNKFRMRDLPHDLSSVNCPECHQKGLWRPGVDDADTLEVLVTPCFQCAREHGFFWGEYPESNDERTLWLPLRCNGILPDDLSSFRPENTPHDECTNHETIMYFLLNEIKQLDSYEHMYQGVDAFHEILRLLDTIKNNLTEYIYPASRWNYPRMFRNDLIQYISFIHEDYQKIIHDYHQHLHQLDYVERPSFINLYMPNLRLQSWGSPPVENAILNLENKQTTYLLSLFESGNFDLSLDTTQEIIPLMVEPEPEPESEISMKQLCKDALSILDDVMDSERENNTLQEGEYMKLVNILKQIHD